MNEFGENPKIMAEIAVFYYRAGKVKDFQAYREKLEKLPTRDKSLYEFLIKAALLDERFNEIPDLVENLLRIEPGELEAMMTAGRVLFENGKLVDAAKWFIDAIKQRQETLYVTMNAIMHFQEEFFLDGEETKMKPMILKDIADMVGLDISTISRVANSKYVETPYGTKLIKEFFSEAMKNDQGEDVSTLEIKKILQNVIAEEDKHKPLPDDQLAEILKERGYPIARRTIAKYRELLDIPVARMRKKM
jgi:tetratricopeptide (TPR) repeat protein